MLNEIENMEISSKEFDDELKEVVNQRIINKRIFNFLSNRFANVEAKNKEVKKVVMSSEDFQILRKYCKEFLYVETSLKIIEHLGFVGSLWGALIFINNDIKDIQFL